MATPIVQKITQKNKEKKTVFLSSFLLEKAVNKISIFYGMAHLLSSAPLIASTIL
jgi:hypothetical protein